MGNVRAATRSDCEEIYRIQVAAMRSLPSDAQGKAGIEEWLVGQQPSVYANSMVEELFAVAEEGGVIVGWGALSVPKREITNIFVDPAFHRQHIGTKILAYLESLALTAEIKIVQLQATGTAIDFYLANDFQSDPPVEAGADWALMKKCLA